MTEARLDARERIDALLRSVQHDRERSSELFDYVWTVMCVRRGLLREIDEVSADGRYLAVEETRTGRQRRVPRPQELDAYTETLAVQALARLIDVSRQAT